jgi:hypothetical protein
MYIHNKNNNNNKANTIHLELYELAGNKTVFGPFVPLEEIGKQSHFWELFIPDRHSGNQTSEQRPTIVFQT